MLRRLCFCFGIPVVVMTGWVELWEGERRWAGGGGVSGSLGGGTPSGDSAVVVVAVVAADVEEEVEFLAADDSAVEGIGVGSSVLGSATVIGWSQSTGGSRGTVISCLLCLFRHDDQSAA